MEIVENSATRIQTYTCPPYSNCESYPDLAACEAAQEWVPGLYKCQEIATQIVICPYVNNVPTWCNGPIHPGQKEVVLITPNPSDPSPHTIANVDYISIGQGQTETIKPADWLTVASLALGVIYIVGKTCKCCQPMR